jgi:hypothetical protein
MKESLGVRALIAGGQALPTKAPISRLQAGGGADLHLDAAQDLLTRTSAPQL